MNLAEPSEPETWKSVGSSADQQILQLLASRLTQMFWFWLARWRPPSKLKVLITPVAEVSKKYWVQPTGARLL